MCVICEIKIPAGHTRCFNGLSVACLIIMHTIHNVVMMSFVSASLAEKGREGAESFVTATPDSLSFLPKLVLSIRNIHRIAYGGRRMLVLEGGCCGGWRVPGAALSDE